MVLKRSFNKEDLYSFFCLHSWAACLFTSLPHSHAVKLNSVVINQA